MADQALVIGNTYDFRATITKDGAAWNLASATVTVEFKQPDGTTVSKSATVLSASAGTVSYTNDADLLASSGQWTRAWKVVDGSIVQKGLPIPFNVQESP